MKYTVTVRRIVREDTVVTVEADNPDAARREAELVATSVPQVDWDTYDCEYSCDEPRADDVEEQLARVPTGDE